MLEPRDYLVLVARNWLVLLVTTAVGLATAGVLILVVTPQYESRAQVVFTAHNAANGQDLAYAGTYVQSRIQTYKDLATSPTVMSTVIDALGLDETPRGLADRTEVDVSQIDTVVGIAVRDPSAKAAARIANAAAQALLEAVSKIEASKTQTAESPTVEGVVVGEATVESSPAYPNKWLFLLTGLLAGLLVGLGVVAVRQVLRSSGVSRFSAVPETG